MKTERHGTAKRKMGYFLAGLGGAVLPFQQCRSPKEKNDGTAWRGFNPPAYLPVIPAIGNGMERQGTAWNGNTGKAQKRAPQPG